MQFSDINTTCQNNEAKSHQLLREFETKVFQVYSKIPSMISMSPKLLNHYQYPKTNSIRKLILQIQQILGSRAYFSPHPGHPKNH